MILKALSQRKDRTVCAALALAAAIALAACGGGGSSSQASSGPSGPPVPTCPTVAGGSNLTAPTTGKTPAVHDATWVTSLNPTTVNDPLFQYQWHLLNTGQTSFADAGGMAGEDIHQTATTTQTGYGIKIAIVDTGLELAHEDLAPNIVTGASSNFLNGGNDPSPATGGTNCTDHGTSVAGVAAARAQNGIGGRGVAGMASLVGYNALAAQTLTAFLSGLGGASYASDVDVFNQSYGSSFDSANLASDTSFGSFESQYASGVGAGAIYTKAAGNGYQVDEQGVLSCNGGECQDASFDQLNTVPYNIVVGALTGGGFGNGSYKTDYSSAGSAIWISAPGGEYGISNTFLNPYGYNGSSTLPAIVTTDLMGCSRGYSVNYFNIYWALTVDPFDIGGAPNTSCNYTASFNGTSSATPVVSGAIALMRQANPALTWRDVKHILATTAVVVDASNQTYGGSTCTPAFIASHWNTNGAGHPFNRFYGFGRIDVQAAVSQAASWVTNGYAANGFGTVAAKPLIDTTWVGPGVVNATIADCIFPINIGTPATSSYAPATTVGFIEAVRVRVFLTHPEARQLGITITNNATTTVSALLVPDNGLAASAVGAPNNDSLDFLTNAFYGEASTAAGFTLSVVDLENYAPLGGGTLNSWQIRVIGHN